MRNPDYDVIRPARATEYSNISDPPFSKGTMNHVDFICKAIANRVSCINKSRGRRVHPTSDPAVNGLWVQCRRYMAELLKMVNKAISKNDKDSINPAFANLYTLMYLDLQLSGLLWKAHLQGAFAYAEYVGGLKVIIQSPRSCIFFLYILQ